MSIEDETEIEESHTKSSGQEESFDSKIPPESSLPGDIDPVQSEQQETSLEDKEDTQAVESKVQLDHNHQNGSVVNGSENGLEIKNTEDVEGEHKKGAEVEGPEGDENNDSASDSEDEESDYDSNEDEVPPLLKYSRTNKLPANFFSEEPISTCCFHQDYFIFATHLGIIHICKPDFLHLRTFKAHRASVLSIYTDGNYFATGSMDGTIVIGSILDEKDITAYDFKRPIHAVILDKNYAKTGAFISGGMSGKVLYSSKNWLGKRVDVVLDEDHGPIVSVQMLDDLLFWMNDNGITIYQISSKQIISTISKPQDSPRSDLYWPRVNFPEADRILIAWGNYIWSLRISLKPKEESSVASSAVSMILPSTASISFRTVQEKKVEVEHIYRLDSPISGITTFKDDLWVVLTYEPHTIDEDTGKRVFHNPDLKLINSINGEVELEEEIGLKNIENLGLNDFLLGSHYGENATYYIVSAKDLVVAQEFQLSDRLEWYISHGKFQEAWEMSEHLVTPIKRLNYGVQNVDNLVEQNEWDKALEFLLRMLKIDERALPEGDGKSTILTSKSDDSEQYINEVIRLWDTWANICIKTNHIKELTTIIPTNPKFSLDKSIYNEILEYWLKEDIDRFYQIIDSWNLELYDVKLLELTLEETLNRTPDNVELRRYLTKLYEVSFEPIKSVPHLIKLRDQNVISYISQHHIFGNFIKELPSMIELKFTNKELSTLPIKTIGSRISEEIDIIVDHRQEFLPKEVLKIFQEANLDFINYFYLEKLLEIDDYVSTHFSNERINLFTLYDRSKLLSFLQRNSNYDIDTAIELCKQNDFIEELVYLLGKIGENKQALELIITKLNDPIKAIEFAKRQNDKEVWDILLDYSMTKPIFINALIENADDQSNVFYDPITILKKMPKDIRVQGLTESVIKFSNNNELNLILNQLMLIIVYKQSEETSHEYRLQKLRGFELDPASFARLIQRFDALIITKFGNNFQVKSEIELFEEKIVSPFDSMENKLKSFRSIVGKIKLAEAS